MILRAVLSAIVFLPIVRFSSLWKSDTTLIDLGRFLLLGATGLVIYQYALNLASESATATVVAIMATLAPMLTAVLAWYWLKEAIPGRALLGGAVAFLGVLLVVVGPTGDVLGRTEPLGALVALIPPMAWAVYTVVAKPLFARYGWKEVAIISTVLGGLLLAPWSLGPLAKLPGLSVGTILAVLYLAVVSTNFAYLVWNRALAGLETHQAAGWIYIVPLVTAITAIPVLGESVTYGLVIGGALIVVGVILVERRAPG